MIPGLTSFYFQIPGVVGEIEVIADRFEAAVQELVYRLGLPGEPEHFEFRFQPHGEVH